MGLSVTPLIRDVEKMSNHLSQEKKAIKTLEEETYFFKSLKEKMVKELQENKKLDWTEGFNRNLLDRLYETEAFQLHEKIYAFKDLQKAAPLVQEIDTYCNEQENALLQKRNIIAQKQSQLEQYQQEILRIISQLSHCATLPLR